MESIANFDPEIMALLSEYMTCSHESGLELGSEFPSMYSSDHDMVPWNCLETLVFPNNVGGYYISDPALASDYYLAAENGSNASPTHDESENALEPVSPPHWKPSPKRGRPTLELDTSPIHENENVAKVSPKKRSRPTTATNENVRKMQPKKAQSCNKSLDSEECNNRSLLRRQGSRSYSLEDDFVESQEIIEAGDNSSAKGTKTRANRGSATDPQSIYARKRRERINERLRILQNLVPNGTKVDISTMLEEAVQYVKFLQLQIKLLSSDELWMYAPIAYNGMSIGLDMKISLP